jgi:hypothetical protein
VEENTEKTKVSFAFRYGDALGGFGSKEDL